MTAAPGPGRVTLGEIAAAANVSVPTVSKVINGRSDVAAETRTRVESLLHEYGYLRPQRRSRRAGLIDLLFTDLSPWAVEIIRGAEEAALAAKSRIAVSVIPSEQDADRWVRSLSRGRTDGVILVLTELPQRHRKRLAELHADLVIVDPVGQPDPDVPSIGAANWAGGLAATEHLIQLGHRRIGTITGRPRVLCSQARLDGYRAALERAGIEVDPALIAPGDFHYESALEAARTMLELPDPPTAIFAASDVQAMGVYEAARLNGLRMPEDLSVVGFDDVPMSRWMSPPLTTLRQPLAEMAALAVRTLVSGDSADFNHRVELSTNLVIRSSTAPPAR
ncbi:LacI family DNA-binding transcriptional regulator [Actinoallomurus sp. CA-150999]|uniref:LacI family DNA-binding transcriptional regulator n=1 Tax=Actinoallomurus sp. CA-150999 TaxID=3239887 RepID=UPI003D8BEE95